MVQKTKAHRSLRSTLTLWFLAFSIIPLAFLSGYSTVVYEDSINNELRKRLEGNIREVGVTLIEIEQKLKRVGQIHANDPTLVYHVATRNIPSTRRIVRNWLKTHSASKILVFDRDGRLIVAESRDSKGQTKSLSKLESSGIHLSTNLTKKIKKNNQEVILETVKEKGVGLFVYSAVKKSNGKVVGYLEERIELGQDFLESVKKKLNLDVVIFDNDQKLSISTNPDFTLYEEDFFAKQVKNDPDAFFEITSRGTPFGIIVRKIVDLDNRPYVILGLAASKIESQKVLTRIKIALLTMAILILLFLVPTLIFVSSRVLNPIHKLVNAAEKMEAQGEVAHLEDRSGTEVGVLVESFNKMAQKVTKAQKDLKSKVDEVEKTNTELKATQTSLVHSAKMAGIGGLVAGVAHELNNPIGFIYSNMTHLKDYAERLLKVLKVAESDPSQLEKVKKEVDLDFVISDLPKLIASCEDGARRTRDIVVGLRNFSRLEEARLQRIDLTEGIQNTIKLLAGELKNRIKVTQDYGDIPEVRCYPSQLNQVFMNIIGNAAQAIPKKGEIGIKTWLEGDQVCISIKDSGPGISQKIQEQIFDPFFTTKPVGKGTGLGLSISYGIIQKHDGTLKVHSDGKNGTEFVISIPVDGPAKEEA